ncbi:GTPase IMAP family member 8 isoform X1 [Cyprinodon tularosa]|uniref:GTPase IMAP family member 8 isoform X1 n=1 Tax=Cyprinodon tularosa TaxID=77115 RepID=UPI0018E25883|nr:GTPase IMAP family member 8 isoform X1 [Cyprinodon tularosa]
MAQRRLSEWDGSGTSKLNIVLLGGRNSGKNSLGNLILGKEEFVTKERTSSTRRLGVVARHWLTVVDTPGWWCDSSAQETTNLVKREIITSVSLCPPGPHVFLITVKASSIFSERRRRAVEEHVALLGDGVWDHSIVIFTFAYRFQPTQTKECIERGGKALRWLIEKCGQRCHGVVLNDNTDIRELLVKIRKLVSENGNRVFEVNEDILRLTIEESRGVAEKAQLRFLKMKRQRSLMREKSRPITTIRLVLLGAKGSGKTSALNTILCRENGKKPGRTNQCCVGDGVVFGRQVTIVDTPGWWMNYFCIETPLFDRREMVLSLSLCPPGPQVFLLMIRADRAFTETYRRAVQEHLELISERIWSRVILLFSFGDWLGGTTTEKFIESEGEPLRWLVEKCSNRYQVFNNKTKGDGFQVRELIGKIEETMSGCNGSWHYEIEKKWLENLMRKMRKETEEANERLRRKERQRLVAKSALEKLIPLQELRMALVGGRKGGKSSCGNTILGRDGFATNTPTVSCTEDQCKINGKTVSVLDTPGSFPIPSEFLKTPSVILVVVNVSSSFRDLHQEEIEKQMDAEGNQVWSRAMVLFSHGDWLGDTGIERRIESEGETLRRLVEHCGNRYHVMDNKNRGDGAQVRELIELVEEMLATQRLADLDKGDLMWKTVCSAEDRQTDAMLRKRNPTKRTSRRQRLSLDVTDSASLTSYPDESDATQALALPERRVRRQSGYMCLDTNSLVFVSVLKQGRSWSTIDLPLRFPPSFSHMTSPRLQTMLLVSCQNQPSIFSEEDFISVNSLCHPALRERTLHRISESGGLQALIDEWGHSSLGELEAFIDSYFEMVWEQTMGSFQPSESDPPAAEQEAVIRGVGEEDLLLSIDRKLTRLELLEEIQKDLAELKGNLACSWAAIQELRDKSKKDID